MSDPAEWYLEWVPVDLPWSEPEGSWQEIDMPDTTAEERAMFEGKTFEEISEHQTHEYRRQRQLLLSQEGIDDEDEISESGATLRDLDQKRNALLDELYEKVAQLPAMQDWARRRDAALQAHHKTYFAALAEPGMIVETLDGEHLLIGDVSVSGGIGTEHFPLRGKHIVRYCRLHPYPLDKRFLDGGW